MDIQDVEQEINFTELDEGVEEEIKQEVEISDLKNEIDSFLKNLFIDLIEVTEDNLHFIQINELVQPKDNFLFLVTLLESVAQHFTQLDYKRDDTLSKKLHKDIINLTMFYDEQESKYIDMYDCFHENFIKHSKLLKIMSENISDETTLKSYKKLEGIYYELFSDMLIKKRKELLHSFLIVINVKIFYLDRLLWLDAKKSEPIMRFLRAVKMDESVNSKNYIAYKLENEPYSKHYTYLKKCLRIYK